MTAPLSSAWHLKVRIASLLDVAFKMRPVSRQAMACKRNLTAKNRQNNNNNNGNNEIKF
jgi:hypothetical protein